MSLIDDLGEVEKRKIFCPDMESNHDISVIQPFV
jgi:hypothetical protein